MKHVSMKEAEYLTYGRIWSGGKNRLKYSKLGLQWLRDQHQERSSRGSLLDPI